MPEEKCPKVFMKIHRTQGETLVAVCDRDALGKKFKEGEFSLRVSEGFYKGTLIGIDDCEPFLKEATIANFVGKESVSKAISLGLVERENVMVVAGVPHAQMVRIFL